MVSENEEKASLFMSSFIPAYFAQVVTPGLRLFGPIQSFNFTDPVLRQHISHIFCFNKKVANILLHLKYNEEMTKANSLSVCLLNMLYTAGSNPNAAVIAKTKEQVSAFKNEIEPLINKNKALIDSLEPKIERKATIGNEALINYLEPKAITGEDKKLFCTIVVGAVLVAALIEVLQYFFVAGDCGFGLKQGVEMCAETCVLALSIISYIFSTNIPSTREDQNQREKKCTQLAFAVFLTLSSLAPDLVAKADQLHLPILAVFAGFFLRQISLSSRRSFLGINMGGGGVPLGRKAAGSMLASCGALAFAYPLIKLWVQSGDNINQFAQTMFKAHCLEAVAAIAGIVLSLGILYRHSDEIRGGVSLVMG